jgi:hypothetical protein
MSLWPRENKAALRVEGAESNQRPRFALTSRLILDLLLWKIKAARCAKSKQRPGFERVQN